MTSGNRNWKQTRSSYVYRFKPADRDVDDVPLPPDNLLDWDDTADALIEMAQPAAQNTLEQIQTSLDRLVQIQQDQTI